MSVNEKVLEGLLEAIKAEGDGYHFYTMAAASTEDEKGRETFRMLALEEHEHLKYLKAQYKSILESGNPDSNIKLPKQKSYEGLSPIFSESIKKRIKKSHFEMSSLSIGMQLEMGAIKHYTEQRDLADDEVVKNFYQELVDWESEHYRLLSQQQDYLKEDYWAAGGFSPF
jgi:rubrerythrin